jgi:hypothetical protein
MYWDGFETWSWLIEVLTWQPFGRAEENYEKHARIAGVRAKTRIGHLPNTSPKCYLYTNMLGGFSY